MSENITKSVTLELKDLDESVKVDIERIRRDIEETVTRHRFSECEFTLMWVDGQHPFVDFSGLLTMPIR